MHRVYTMLCSSTCLLCVCGYIINYTQNLLKGMGHKHSKKLRSPPEVTEIIELNDNSDTDRRSSATSSVMAAVPEDTKYPSELRTVMENVERLETGLGGMTDSQMDLYYATFKDDLHNNWQKVYGVVDATTGVKEKKIETIERIKGILKRLDDRVLRKNATRRERQ